MLDALWSEREVPAFLYDWLVHLINASQDSAGDRLRLLMIRLAHIKATYRTAELANNELYRMATILEHELLNFERDELKGNPTLSCRVTDTSSAQHSWKAIRHDYASVHGFLYWTHWRMCWIMLSRLQLALRRQAAVYMQIYAQMHDPGAESDAARSRQDAVDDICASVLYALPRGPNKEPPPGSLSMASTLLLPLMVAGTHCIEQLSDPMLTADGRRVVFVAEALHRDESNATSAQLAYIIDKVDYIANEIDLRRAAEVGSFLKGERRVYYDLGRS